MMRCIECGHDLIEKEKTYVANLDHCVIVIKNVPALVCEHCKEVYYTDDVFEKIETTVNKLKNIINDVAIIDYNKQAA